MHDDTQKTPSWVWALVLLLAATQPVLLAWIYFAPPEGAAPTGLHIPDSALFLYSMDLFSSGFYSGYAGCAAPDGAASITYYAVPHLWLYGLLGLLNRLLPVAPFLLYGLANGLGFGLYLYAVYRFLRLVTPAMAGSAFLLFALSNGPGGILYLAAAATGIADHPAFAEYFDRFALYTLCEGPHLNPVLYAPRFYYTLSLAGLFAAMTCALRAGPLPGRTLFSIALLAAPCAFINARFGLFTCAILGLALVLLPEPRPQHRLRALLAFALPAAAGCGVSALLMRLNPAVIQNHMGAGAMAMWFSPFIAAAGLHLLLAIPVWRRELFDGAQARVRIARALSGYLAAYALATLCHQVWYGSLLTGRDSTVAATVSDWALAGLLAAFLPVRPRDNESPEQRATPFFLFWFLCFCSISLSGWGQGWFLRFGPQRLEVLLWLPICTLTAMTLARYNPAARRILTTGLLAAGIPAILTALWVFQGPARPPAAYTDQTPFFMTEEDRDAIDAMPDGRVLAPPPASDIAAQHDHPVVFGIGSFNLTSGSYSELRRDTARFFSVDATEAERRAFLEAQCATIVYCPDTWPVDPRVIDTLRGYAWLRLERTLPRGAVFTLNPASSTP